jgi:CheY-like chemotaxis protein
MRPTMQSPREDPDATPLLLVVEDDADTREVLVAALREAGYAVLASDEGRKALELAGAMRPAAVVLDLTMPGMDGREFLARRREVPGVARTPVVVVTGGDAGDVDANVVLTKPVDIATLVDAIRRATTRSPRR